MTLAMSTARLKTVVRSTRWFLTLVLATLFCHVGFADDTTPSMSGLEWLDDYSTSADSLIPIVVFMENETLRADLAVMNSQPDLRRSSRIKRTIQKLQSARAKGADEVLGFLSEASQTGVITHWIVPAYSATLSASDIKQLESLNGVKSIVPDVSLVAMKPVEVTAAPMLSSAVSAQLQLLNVPQVRAKGFTGKGRLVCSLDTGVEQPHPALSSKWRGNHAPLSSCWFSPIKPNVLPYDAAGHGTHTMGVMVGSTVADSFGVAPGAEWISAGVIDQGRSLQTTISDIIQAFQWALNPDGDAGTTDDVPDVILNSWGIPAGIFDPCDDTFWQLIDNVEAAGIVTIFAAGNEGPDRGTIRNPADRASSPFNSFSVGAVDNAKIIGDFSSRGPASCDTTQIKPEVVAPGVAVYSSTKGGGYTLMTGTSMAAPYIAGLVALCRQYNPDATVEEIKWAMIQSAEDLGPVGEDNAYGHGLVDAVRMLEFLPSPSATGFSISNTIVSDEGVTLPGDTISLQVILNDSEGARPQVTGYLATGRDSVVTILNSQTDFYYHDDSSTLVNLIPFQIAFDQNLIHGEVIPFSLSLIDAFGDTIDVLSLSIKAGLDAPGSTGDHTSGRISMTVSDFGQFGLGSGSIYNLDRSGFQFNGSENLLFEAGIIMGTDPANLSSAIRDAGGGMRLSDFAPIENLSSGWSDSQQGFHRRARFTDANAENPIPITIDQETIDYARPGEDCMVIFHYRLTNSSSETIPDLQFGFLADFDLDTTGDDIGYDEDMGLIYQFGGNGPVVGLVALQNITSFKVAENGEVKIGYTPAEQYGLISSEVSGIDTSLSGDLMFITASGSITLAAFESTNLAFALVAGENIDELYRNAERARHLYESVAAGDDQSFGLPSGYELNQNYPNPFNPSTTISFVLPVACDVRLEVFNLLGQRVRLLQDGPLPLGYHAVEWDGRSDPGSEVASGVYFYRLSKDDVSLTKKMVLLK